MEQNIRRRNPLFVTPHLDSSAGTLCYIASTTFPSFSISVPARLPTALPSLSTCLLMSITRHKNFADQIFIILIILVILLILILTLSLSIPEEAQMYGMRSKQADVTSKWLYNGLLPIERLGTLVNQFRKYSFDSFTGASRDGNDSYNVSMRGHDTMRSELIGL
jgi:hypothetical protein